MSATPLYNPQINTSFCLKHGLSRDEGATLDYIINATWAKTELLGGVIYSWLTNKKIAEDLGSVHAPKTIYRHLCKFRKLGLIDHLPSEGNAFINVLQKGLAWLDAIYTNGISKSRTSGKSESVKKEPKKSAETAKALITSEAKAISSKHGIGISESRDYIRLKRSSLLYISSTSTDDMDGIKLPMKGKQTLVIQSELLDIFAAMFPEIDVELSLFEMRSRLMWKTELRYGSSETIFAAIESWLSKSGKRRVKGTDSFEVKEDTSWSATPLPPQASYAHLPTMGAMPDYGLNL